jgi:hypothetical protein
MVLCISLLFTNGMKDPTHPWWGEDRGLIMWPTVANLSILRSIRSKLFQERISVNVWYLLRLSNHEQFEWLNRLRRNGVCTRRVILSEDSIGGPLKPIFWQRCQNPGTEITESISMSSWGFSISDFWKHGTLWGKWRDWLNRVESLVPRSGPGFLAVRTSCKQWMSLFVQHLVCLTDPNHRANLSELSKLCTRVIVRVWPFDIWIRVYDSRPRISYLVPQWWQYFWVVVQQ